MSIAGARMFASTRAAVPSTNVQNSDASGVAREVRSDRLVTPQSPAPGQARRRHHGSLLNLVNLDAKGGQRGKRSNRR